MSTDAPSTGTPSEFFPLGEEGADLGLSLKRPRCQSVLSSLPSAIPEAGSSLTSAHFPRMGVKAERPGWGRAGSEHRGWGALLAAARVHWLPRPGRGLRLRPPPPAASTLAAAGLDLAGPRRHEPQSGRRAELPGAAGGAGRPGGGRPRRRVQREWRAPALAPRTPVLRPRRALPFRLGVPGVSPPRGSLRVSLPSASLLLLLSPSSPFAHRGPAWTDRAHPPGVLARPEQPGWGGAGGAGAAGRGAALLRRTAPAPPLLAT